MKKRDDHRYVEAFENWHRSSNGSANAEIVQVRRQLVLSKIRYRASFIAKPGHLQRTHAR